MGGEKDDASSKVIEHVLVSVKENTERAIDAAKESNETVKWVYVVQSALAGAAGSILAFLGGVLAFWGFKSVKDFQRFQIRARKQRQFIRRRFLEDSMRIENRFIEESNRMGSWAEINTQFSAASVPLANLAAIRDEEVREEIARVSKNVAPDEIARAQRESRKFDAYKTTMNAISKLKKLATENSQPRYLSWAEAAEAAANLCVGKLDTARERAEKAKADNPMHHADRANYLGYIYARMYYEQEPKNPELRSKAIQEFREAFSQDITNRLAENAKRDPELELYLGKETVAEITSPFLGNP